MSHKRLNTNATHEPKKTGRTKGGKQPLYIGPCDTSPVKSFFDDGSYVQGVNHQSGQALTTELDVCLVSPCTHNFGHNGDDPPTECRQLPPDDIGYPPTDWVVRYKSGWLAGTGKPTPYRSAALVFGSRAAADAAAELYGGRVRPTDPAPLAPVVPSRGETDGQRIARQYREHTTTRRARLAEGMPPTMRTMTEAEAARIVAEPEPPLPPLSLTERVEDAADRLVEVIRDIAPWIVSAACLLVLLAQCYFRF